MIGTFPEQNWVRAHQVTSAHIWDRHFVGNELSWFLTSRETESYELLFIYDPGFRTNVCTITGSTKSFLITARLLYPTSPHLAIFRILKSTFQVPNQPSSSCNSTCCCARYTLNSYESQASAPYPSLGFPWGFPEVSLGFPMLRTGSPVLRTEPR